jgi:N-acetylglucosamine-6-phosphate deacetylase
MSSTRNLLIKNVRLLSNNDSVDIRIEDGKLTAIDRGLEFAGKTLNGEGRLVVPGLIDLHIHGAGGTDLVSANRQEMDNMAATLARLGTTSFLAAAVYNPNHHEFISDLFSCLSFKGADLLGLYLEGPFINRKKRGGIPENYIKAPSLFLLQSIREQSHKNLKIMTVAPEVEGIERIIDFLRQHDIIAALGHSNADYETANHAYKNGVSHITHSFNAMTGLHHREPGPVVAAVEYSHVYAEVICDGVHIHPAIVNMIYKLFGTERIVCITDGIAGMGLPDGTWMYDGREYISKGGIARYPDGTLIGTTQSLLQLALNFKRFSGCHLQQAFDTVTLNPARVLGIDKQKGSLSVGKDADLLLLDADFSVYTTVIDGNIVYQKDNPHKKTFVAHNA